MNGYNACLLGGAIMLLIYGIVAFGYSAQHMYECSNKLGVELVAISTSMVVVSGYVGYRCWKEQDSYKYGYVDIFLSLFALSINIWGHILYRDTNSLICDSGLLDLSITTIIVVWMCFGIPLFIYLVETFKVQCIYRKSSGKMNAMSSIDSAAI